MSIQPTRTRVGVVTEFDEPVGLGIVTESPRVVPDATSDAAIEVDGGEVRHPFHCTAIADGTRDIAVGAEVTFRLAPARGGRFEATDIVVS